MSDKNPPEPEKDPLEELFGKPIFSYSDSQAIEDGILVALRAGATDTGHRVTRNAYETLKKYYDREYPECPIEDLNGFFLSELLPLAPFALRAYKGGSILTTDFEFRVRKYDAERREQLWYLPNEVSGITMLLPEDY